MKLSPAHTRRNSSCNVRSIPEIVVRNLERAKFCNIGRNSFKVCFSFCNIAWNYVTQLRGFLPPFQFLTQAQGFISISCPLRAKVLYNNWVLLRFIHLGWLTTHLGRFRTCLPRYKCFSKFSVYNIVTSTNMKLMRAMLQLWGVYAP